MDLSFDALQGIILAAGKSNRFGTGHTKVLEPINGQAMLVYSVKLLKELGIKISVVIGHEGKRIQEYMVDYNLSYCLQPEQKGTAHALLCSQAQWNKEHILVINADMPLIDSTLIRKLYAHHLKEQAALSFVVAHNTSNTTDYGRLVESDGIQYILEARDFNASVQDYPLINAGIYIINHAFVSTAITRINNTNSAQEFYITDLIKQASIIGRLSYIQTSFACIQGVNTFEQLHQVETLQKENIIKQHMANGVRFDAPTGVKIDVMVRIAPGVHIADGVHLLGKCSIDNDVIIGPYCIIKDSSIANNTCLVGHCVVTKSTIAAYSHIGPFSHIEGNSSVGSNAVIGSFVHINRSTLGSSVKAKHLAYLGDAHLANRVNVGAGVIIANYNGVSKYKTIIDDDAFLGSNTTLIAPIKVGASSYIAAGSTITKDVEPSSLAIARNPQTNKINYVPHLRAKKRGANAAQLLLKKNIQLQSL